MQLTSSAFSPNGVIPVRYTCDGDNVNPPLAIAGVPAAAVSLVLIMDDPDVPKKLRADGMWDHWIVFNIPPDLAKIEEGAEPPGVRGIGTGGNHDYHGPCPPDREHRYFFKLYALDCRLDLPAGATKTRVEAAMAGHILAQAELMGRYDRPRR
ncbi:YbhB/YbcL family Raf kinase inhibitor-like protein [Desulfurivibrio alkaliphilus]|uniref:PEBP family protein n=1 Tax=Desulfurivibrio alkaliphilus (strain DSM 19089 / UNIQEM U267 / AHT2) TaxID=589865 RepID=D6Z5Z0_DESAT|nr:YbhB/YbcL family Raf kinase inhibitor-like protein [Desulfurivibrio alkaliphilus]ADH84872.1 PEBP family protein [Desulfurivibrio alkaliphilus AHT 2]